MVLSYYHLVHRHNDMTLLDLTLEYAIKDKHIKGQGIDGMRWDADVDGNGTG